MNLKEHLQFLIMMIPTLLLLVAAAATLAFPTASMGKPVPIALGIATGAVLSGQEPENRPIDTEADR